MDAYAVCKYLQQGWDMPTPPRCTFYPHSLLLSSLFFYSFSSIFRQKAVHFRLMLGILLLSIKHTFTEGIRRKKERKILHLTMLFDID
jgi:hypothetical protein